MRDFKQLVQQNYLLYASYVILERAIPDVLDGLKPVQRRILYTLHQMHDGKMHKVANIAGQTMALHPHGDAAITDALIQLANKGYLLDTQGNFGNLYTGDPAAASRYIESRLGPLATETMFNPDLTDFVPSYDGRQKEPVALPAKVPLLLMQGVDGIAVGMSTHILPHNFVEVLESEIAVLEGKPFTLVPDFLTGGVMDASDYAGGKGKVRLRAKIELVDQKTLVVREICHGTTTESLIRSVDEAAKRGKIKIDSISDYTADKVEIEIKLPRGQYAKDLLNELYVFTECEVTLHSHVLVIKDDLPWETNVDEILAYHTEKLKEYIRRELEIERDRLKEKIFNKSLEQIFIENRLYKKIENLRKYEEIHQTIEKSLVPFHKNLFRIPTYDDRERLLNIPIRRISRFDLEKNRQEISDLEDRLQDVENRLKNIKKEAIRYLKGLIKKYGKQFPRKTKLKAIEELDKRSIQMKEVKVGYNPKTGYVGTNVAGEYSFTCTNFDRLLLFYDDGNYQVIPIPEKKYVLEKKHKLVYVGVADKKTVLSAVYRDPKTRICFGKRFIVKKFIMERNYRYFEEGKELAFLTTAPETTLELQFVPKPKQKLGRIRVNLHDLVIKRTEARGVRLAAREVKKVVQVNGKGKR